MINNTLNPIKTVTLSVKLFPALKSIAEYLRLVESLDFKINKLIQHPLNTAILYLKVVEKAYSYGKVRGTREDIKSAKDKFIEAIDFENHVFDNCDRVFATYYGLALCQYLLKDFVGSINTLENYSELKLQWSFRKQAIVQGRTFLIILPSLFVFSPVLIPLLKLSEIKKINVIDNSMNKVNEWIPFALKTKKSLIEQSQNKAAKFAEKIKEIESLNILQTIFSKKEQKLLERLSEYFNNHKAIL